MAPLHLLPLTCSHLRIKIAVFMTPYMASFTNLHTYFLPISTPSLSLLTHLQTKEALAPPSPPRNVPSSRSLYQWRLLSPHTLNCHRNLPKGFLCTVADHPADLCSSCQEASPDHLVLIPGFSPQTTSPSVLLLISPAFLCSSLLSSERCEHPGSMGCDLSSPVTCHNRHLWNTQASQRAHQSPTLHLTDGG